MTAIAEARALVAKNPLLWDGFPDGWRARELLAEFVAALDEVLFFSSKPLNPRHLLKGLQLHENPHPPRPPHP